MNIIRPIQPDDYESLNGIANASGVGFTSLPVNKELLTSSYEYYADYEADAIVRTDENGNPRRWAKGVGAVQVTYKAGFASTPRDLQLALFDLVNYYMKDEHKERRTLGGAQLQNQGTAGMRNSTDFPDHIKRVLDLYKVVI